MGCYRFSPKFGFVTGFSSTLEVNRFSMDISGRNPFLGSVKVFRERRLPVAATPAGYAALINAYALRVPLPRILSGTGDQHRQIQDAGWRIYSPRYSPKPSLGGHLTFALKHEGLDLAVLKRLFEATGPAPVEELVRARPTGVYTRRVWFLYEWLTGHRLDLPDADRGRYPPVVDPARQFTARSETSRRHRVKNNLPGTPAFCPLVFRTEALDRLSAMSLGIRARDAAAAIPKDVLARTAAFLLLKDSKSSFSIEGEHPPHDRIHRWGRAIGMAGQAPVDLEEMLRLQQIVIGDARFIRLGLRTEGGFVGERDRETRMPIPDHISARPEDLPGLVEGLVTFAQDVAPELDPVVAASVLAFGFVYIHPFEDGNGRLHARSPIRRWPSRRTRDGASTACRVRSGRNAPTIATHLKAPRKGRSTSPTGWSGSSTAFRVRSMAPRRFAPMFCARPTSGNAMPASPSRGDRRRCSTGFSMASKAS